MVDGRRHSSGTFRNPRGGFTLVELLVTLTIFAAALAALMAGLRGGIHTWRLVRTHQMKQANATRTLDQLAKDVRHIAVIDGKQSQGDQAQMPPPLVGISAGDSGDDSLMMTIRASRPVRRTRLDGEWAYVTYQAVKDETTKTTDLVRTTQAKVAKSTFGPPQDTILLTGIKSLKFQYFKGGDSVPAWESTSELPAYIRLTCQRVEGETIIKTLWLPAGALGKPGS